MKKITQKVTDYYGRRPTLIRSLFAYAKKEKLAKAGDRIILLSGESVGVFDTFFLSVHQQGMSIENQVLRNDHDYLEGKIQVVDPVTYEYFTPPAPQRLFLRPLGQWSTSPLLSETDLATG